MFNAETDKRSRLLIIDENLKFLGPEKRESTGDFESDFFGHSLQEGLDPVNGKSHRSRQAEM